MGQVFSSNGRECFGLGSEIPKPEQESKEGQEAKNDTSVKSTESEYPPGHPNYAPKKFKPSPTQPPPASIPAPVGEPSDPDSFRPFISPRYHLHLHLSGNDPVPYGAEGALLEPCDQCVRMKRPVPTMVESDVCMCKPCWDEGTEDMRHVVRHRNNLHKHCPKDYPQSELQYLPDNSSDVIAHWRAEWRHSHGDHELCRPHYLFGCTAVEELQLQQLQAHQRGEHANCPKEFPVFMLKPSVQDEDPGEDDDELGEDTKAIWRAAWRHEHGDHEACTASLNYGCDHGISVPVDGDIAAAVGLNDSIAAVEGSPEPASPAAANTAHPTTVEFAAIQPAAVALSTAPSATAPTDAAVASTAASSLAAAAAAPSSSAAAIVASPRVGAGQLP